MNTIQNIGLTEITTVELGNSTIGEDINSRFENIHNNFNVLSTTDYLKGDKGNSVKIIEFPIGLSVVEYPVVYEQNDLETPLTPEKLYNDLVLIITSESKDEDESEDEDEIESETQTPISELNGLGENGYNKINLICEEVVENGVIKNILKGSLPFLYLDPNFSNGQNLSTDKQNYSCLIIYDDNGFKKSTSIPKLYYDKNIEDGENNKGSFCWEINGYQTGIIAQGPQGKNGRDGNCYIVKLGNQIENDNENFDKDVGLYEIKQVFVVDKNPIGWINYENFKENDNQLSIGSSCMCVFETHKENEETHEEIYESKLCFGVVAEISQNMERVIGVSTDLSTNIVNFGAFTLLDALSNISSNSEAGIRGLFVPYTTKANDVQRGHMIWANSVSDDLDTVPNEEDHSLHIGPIKNVLNNDLEIDNETIRANELNVHYGDIIFDNGDKEVKIQSKNEEDLIIKGHDHIKLKTTVASANIDISETTELNATELNLNASELNLNADDDITVNCAHITIGDSNDGSIILNGENASVNINAEGFAVKSPQEVNISVDGVGEIYIGQEDRNNIMGNPEAFYNGKVTQISMSKYGELKQGSPITKNVAEVLIQSNVYKIPEGGENDVDIARVTIYAPNTLDTDGQINIQGGSINLDGDNVIIQGDSNVTLDASELNLNAIELNIMSYDNENNKGFKLDKNSFYIPNDIYIGENPKLTKPSELKHFSWNLNGLYNDIDNSGNSIRVFKAMGQNGENGWPSSIQLFTGFSNPKEIWLLPGEYESYNKGHNFVFNSPGPEGLNLPYGFSFKIFNYTKYFLITINDDFINNLGKRVEGCNNDQMSIPGIYNFRVIPDPENNSQKIWAIFVTKL